MSRERGEGVVNVMTDFISGGSETIEKFFDDYPEFQRTSSVSPSPTRLNPRFNALIAQNRGILRGARVLDLGSHDGRWSFAALKNGAASVTGVEGRRRLVENAENVFRLYGVNPSTYEFITGDVNKEVEKLPKGRFDVVFVFGILYHVPSPFDLLGKVTALEPRHVIVDTSLCAMKEPVIELRLDDADLESDSISLSEGKKKTLVGYPSETAVLMMLDELGYDTRKADYHAMGIEDWSQIVDYKEGYRISVTAVRREPRR